MIGERHNSQWGCWCDVCSGLELNGWENVWDEILCNKAREGEGNQKDWHLSRWSYSEGIKHVLEEELTFLKSLYGGGYVPSRWKRIQQRIKEIEKRLKVVAVLGEERK